MHSASGIRSLRNTIEGYEAVSRLKMKRP